MRNRSASLTDAEGGSVFVGGLAAPHPSGRQFKLELVGQAFRKTPALAGVVSRSKHQRDFTLDNGHGSDRSHRYAAVSSGGHTGSPSLIGQFGPAFIKVL